MENKLLSDKIAIITGAGSGLGRACAEDMSASGAKVALLDVNVEAITTVADEINAAGGEAIAIACDVSDEASTLAAAGQVAERFGHIDILVNVAGISRRSVPGDDMEQNWDKCLKINLTGTWLMCRAVIPYMVSQHYGKIVNFSSINSMIGFKGAGIGDTMPYYASKGGINSLTMGIAARYGVDGITCNAVMPGLFKTNMTGGGFYESIVNTVVSRTALDRESNVHEISGAVIFFASDLSSYITGQQLLVDGGASICI